MSRNFVLPCPSELTGVALLGNEANPRRDNPIGRPTMEYTVEQIDQVGDGLLALPPLDPSKQKLDKQAAVRRIKEQIATVQLRGYTLDGVAGCASRGPRADRNGSRSWHRRSDRDHEARHVRSLPVSDLAGHP